MSLLDELAKPRTVPEIILDRSELGLYLSCPFQCKLNREGKPEDHDLSRPALVGIAFHAVLAEYVTELLQRGERSDPDALADLALAGPAKYQPDLLHLAKLTGPRLRIHRTAYIAHEQQYAYKIPNLGPAGETVVLTCRPDLVMYGEAPESLWLPDWKTGWGKSGFDFQAMFYSVVAWRAHEGIESVCWQPFHCRFGTWGPRFEFDAQRLAESEAIIQRAAMDYLIEEDWSPTPGMERCRWCPFTEKCGADRRFPEIDKNPEGFLQGFLKAEASVADMKKALVAKYNASGPIRHDGRKKWGVKPPSTRRTYGLYEEDDPECVGEPDEEAADE